MKDLDLTWTEGQGLGTPGQVQADLMIDQVTVLKSAYAHVGFCRGKMATTGIKMNFHPLNHGPR